MCLKFVYSRSLLQYFLNFLMHYLRHFIHTHTTYLHSTYTDLLFVRLFPSRQQFAAVPSCRLYSFHSNRYTAVAMLFALALTKHGSAYINNFTTDCVWVYVVCCVFHMSRMHTAKTHSHSTCVIMDYMNNNFRYTQETKTKYNKNS